MQRINANMTENIYRFSTIRAQLTYVAGRLSCEAHSPVLPKTNLGIPSSDDYRSKLDYTGDALKPLT